MNTQPKISEYDQQAIDFLESTGTSFEIVYEYAAPYFQDDTEKRDIYRFTLKNSRGEYSGTFGDSLQNSTRRLLKTGGARHSKKSDIQLARDAGVYPKDKTMYGLDVALRKTGSLWEKPSAYDILAGLTKYDPGSFKDFCFDFGYDDQPLSNYPDVMKIYQAVCDEYQGIRRMFTEDQLNLLAEIN